METNIHYTSFYRRLLAHYTDTLLLFLPNLMALFFVASTSQSINQLVINVLLMVATVTLPLMILSTFYSVLMIHFFAATIGQAVSGYAILNSDGTRLNLKRAFFRQTVGKMASSTMFSLGYLSMFKHPQKQAWHDEMVASYAVSRRNTWPLAVLLVLITLGLVIYLLFSTVMVFAKNEPLKKDLSSFSKTLIEEFKKPPQPSPKLIPKYPTAI